MRKEQILKTAAGKNHTMKLCNRKKRNMKIVQHGKSANLKEVRQENSAP